MNRRATEVAAPEEPHAVLVHLDRVLAERGMTLAELSERAGITVANLAVLKNGLPAPCASAP